uniref:serine O-acetyltransferase n=1 Tax=Prasinoderma coloniale TaxID=156133 RepID=A0A7R9TWH3_9VIRI
MVFFKGFAGVQAHRCAHELWLRGKTAAACLIQSRVSEAFGMDVHPAATIGPGFMVDHATGVVIGETAVVGRDVTMLHAVTLGGTGKERGRRHPSVGDGVFIGAGASLLGCIKVGAQAKIGAGTTVVRDVPPGATIVGVVGVQVKKRRGAAGAGAGASDHVADDSLLFDMAGSSGLRERLSELVLLRRRGAGNEPSGDGRAGSASEAEKDAGAGGGGGAKSPRRGLFAAARPRAKL